MVEKRIFAAVLGVFVFASAAVAQEVLFSDGFDGPESETAYEIKTFELAEDPDGFQHFWEFVNYAGLGLPAAPGSEDGSTSGIQIFVNVGGFNAADVVNFYTADSFSGNIRASVDVYMNFVPETSGTTEFFGMGLYPSGDYLINWEGLVYSPDGNDLPNQSDGYFFAMNGDGDSGSRGDYLFTEGFPDGAAGADFLCGTWEAQIPETISDCRVLIETNSENNDPFFAELFPAGEGQHIGSPGNRWVTVAMEYINGVVYTYLNGVLAHTYDDPDDTYTSGKVLLSYEDAFTSNGEGNTFVVLDNFVVEQLDTPVGDWSIMK